MIRPWLVIAVGLAFTAASAAQLKDASPEAQAACRAARDTPIPAADQPAPSERTALLHCDPLDLYYGFDRHPDYDRARKCAYRQLEIEKPSAPLFDPAGILATIYANGKGVLRNVDLAIKFACEAGGAPAEIDGRIQRLEKLRKGDSAEAKFDLCDDATSGYMEGWCEKIEYRYDEAKLKARTAKVSSNWSDDQRRAFASLARVADRFIRMRVESEVDLSGTGRAASEFEEEDKLRKDFVSSLEEFERGELPSFSEAEWRESDQRLNSIYQLTQEKSDVIYGTVTPTLIQKTERVWLEYREAWVKFGLVKYPSVSLDSWRTWLTQTRIEMLSEFARPK